MHMWTAKAQNVLSPRPVAGRGVKGVGHQTCLHTSVPQFRALESSPCVPGHGGKLNLKRLGAGKWIKCHGLEFSLVLSLIGVMIGGREPRDGAQHREHISTPSTTQQRPQPPIHLLLVLTTQCKF